VLHLETLTKTYGDRPVLQDLTLDVRPGEVYGLLGPNGAGKTTTINLICNLLQPDSGRITIDGIPVSDATKRLIGIVPQENLLYRSLTCAENLDFFARIYAVPREKRDLRIATCLAAVNLLDRANSPVETLSGGMQRRLSLAIALVHQPRLVILDEPTTGLDIEARYELWELIRRLRDQGITTLLTTHLLEEAERLCHRIGILKGGRLLAEGTLAELRHYVPAQEVVLVQTTEEERAIARAQQLGFPCRRYGNDLTFWLPAYLDMQDIIACFEGISLDSVCRQPVGLSHIYMEVTQLGTAPVSLAAGDSQKDRFANRLPADLSR
jgi:ABC-2 type transport system ATP-binding protein